RINVDLIGSKTVADEPGGYQAIQDRCARMRTFIHDALRELISNCAINLVPISPQGDDIAFELTSAASAPSSKLADVGVAVIRRAFLDYSDGTLFRYVIYTIPADATYLPRIPVFEKFSKTDNGRQHHICIAQDVVSDLKDAAMTAWLKSLPSVGDTLSLPGEAYPLVRVKYYCRVASSGPLQSVQRSQPTSHHAPPDLYAVPDYILTNTFIGRATELDDLDTWGKSTDPLMVIEGIGGLGKSALTWEWVQKRATQAIPNLA